MGDVVELGTYPPLSDAEIVQFARQWDPQPFHVDAERARESMFGGLVASGWHTGAIAMRLLVDGLLSRSASQGSPGLDHLRFRRPVRPGDQIRFELEVQQIRGRTCRMRGVAKVDGEVAAEADMAAMVRDR